MKIIIKENQTGFVVKNGRFVKLIRAGKYNYPKSFGYEVYIEDMTGEVDFMELPYEILINDKQFKELTVKYNIEDGEIGLIYVNNVLRACTTRNEYVYWNIFDKYEIRKLSMESVRIGDDVTRKMISVIPTKYYIKICVEDGEKGLLYCNNILKEELEPGIYYYWNYRMDISYRIIDMKVNEIDVVGQEILTKDKVGIRMNVTCTYRIVNVRELAANIKDIAKQLYSYIQLTIRELVGNYRLDEILEQKNVISEDIFKKLSVDAGELYVEFKTAGIKDIVLPGEIKDIMNTVLVAEKTAQANVITRREEVASTRSLLNTAKLMDENKTLYRLKELEYLEKICAGVGEISVSGGNGIVKELGKLMGAE